MTTDQTHWKYNRLDPNAVHELSEWAVNPVWKHFRYFRSINTTRCLAAGCGFVQITHAPKTLAKHLEKFHPAEHLQFTIDYPEYDLKRNKEYLRYCRSSGDVRDLSKQVSQSASNEQSTSSAQPAIYQAFDNEVDIEDIREAHNTCQDIESDDDVIFIQELPKNSLLNHSTKQKFTEEAEEFSLMAKMFERHDLDVDCIRYSIVECADLVGIANDVNIFPRQVPSYRGKLQLIKTKINALIEQHNRPGSVDRWLGPLVHYKNLVSSEINAIEHVNAFGINRVLPFILDLLNGLEKERFDWKPELSQFILETMAYAMDSRNRSFDVKFIIALLFNPATVTYLDEGQRNAAVQIVNQQFKQEKHWITEVMEESSKLGEMRIKERLDYNYLRFWKQRSVKYSAISTAVNEFHAIPASAYICDI